jgi:hypothetical protein
MICSRCVMDDTAEEFIRTSTGCNFCDSAINRIKGEIKVGEAERVAAKIKADGSSRPYDCIIGVSGGVDSSYVALTVKTLGLRPLAIHMDNGWNTALATQNITNLLDKLEIPLKTEVLDWTAFRDLQLAFLRAGIPNAEIPTDHVILSLLLRQAAKQGVRHVITGSNVRTEAIMPLSWMSHAIDYRLIKSVGAGTGHRQLPLMTLRRFAAHLFLQKRTLLPILNYVDYVRASAMTELEATSAWIPYDGKHHESVFTRWFQTQYLPIRFGIDKRKPHLSSMIASGQLTRDQALDEISKPQIDSLTEADDRNIVARKFGLELEELDAIVHSEPGGIENFKNSEWAFNALSKVLAAARRRGLSTD